MQGISFLEGVGDICLHLGAHCSLTRIRAAVGWWSHPGLGSSHFPFSQHSPLLGSCRLRYDTFPTHPFPSFLCFFLPRLVFILPQFSPLSFPALCSISAQIDCREHSYSVLIMLRGKMSRYFKVEWERSSPCSSSIALVSANPLMSKVRVQCGLDQCPADKHVSFLYFGYNCLLSVPSEHLITHLSNFSIWHD